jgi:hypothetical protein
VNRLEERLRDAYQAAADTVTREMDPPDLTGVKRRAFRPGIGSRVPAIRLTAPLAAAASVAAITLATSLIATMGDGHGPTSPPGSAGWKLHAVTKVAQGYPGDRIPAASRPRYYLGIQNSPHGPTEYAFTAYVYSSATGQRTGQLTLPRSDLWARAVASLGNGTYVVAATKVWPRFGCRSWLYQFGLTAAGQPTGVKPFVVPQVSGWARQLGGSDDRRMAVLTTSRCIRGRTQPMKSHKDRAFAISLPSGKTTSWSPWPIGSNLVPENVVPTGALSANGRMLGFVAIGGHPQYFGLEKQAAYVMLTRRLSGPVTSRYHLVVRAKAGTGVIATALSPNGQVSFVMTARRHGGLWHETIGAYSTKTGKLITVLASASAHYVEAGGYLVPDPSGSHLLVLGFGHYNTAVLDIASRRLAVLHTHYRSPPLGATW